MRYSEDPDLRAHDDPTSQTPRERSPKVSEAAKQMLANAEDLHAALFDLAEVFRVPVTNNAPWFEDADPDQPVYAIGEFIEQVTEAFTRAGWAPPTVKEIRTEFGFKATSADGGSMFLTERQLGASHLPEAERREMAVRALHRGEQVFAHTVTSHQTPADVEGPWEPWGTPATEAVIPGEVC